MSDDASQDNAASQQVAVVPKAPYPKVDLNDPGIRELIAEIAGGFRMYSIISTAHCCNACEIGFGHLSRKEAFTCAKLLLQSGIHADPKEWVNDEIYHEGMGSLIFHVHPFFQILDVSMGQITRLVMGPDIEFDMFSYRLSKEIGDLKELQFLRLQGECELMPANELRSLQKLRRLELWYFTAEEAFPFPDGLEEIYMAEYPEGFQVSDYVFASLKAYKKAPSSDALVTPFADSLKVLDGLCGESLETFFFNILPKFPNIQKVTGTPECFMAAANRLLNDLVENPGARSIEIPNGPNRVSIVLYEKIAPTELQEKALEAFLNFFQGVYEIRFNKSLAKLPASLQYRLDLNHAGRRLLQNMGEESSRKVPLGLWPRVVAKSTRLKKANYDGLFYMLRHGPMLCGRDIPVEMAQSPVKKRRRLD